MKNYNDLIIITPPAFNFGYLKHFNTKNAEEYQVKIKIGVNKNSPYDICEGVKIFLNNINLPKKK